VQLKELKVKTVIPPKRFVKIAACAWFVIKAIAKTVIPDTIRVET
jgi:hypothetical protein